MNALVVNVPLPGKCVIILHNVMILHHNCVTEANVMNATANLMMIVHLVLNAIKVFALILVITAR